MKDKRELTIFAYILLSLLSVFMIFPFIWMLLASFKNADEIYRLTLFPSKPSLDNYIHIFTSRYSRFGSWFLNSLLIAVTTTISVLFFDSLLGYTLSKFNFPGKRIIFLVIMSTLMIPTEMLIIPWYSISVLLKWVDTRWGIMFPGMISAFGMFLMRQFMSSIPEDLLDAARIDGQGEFRIYLTIAIPLASSALATLAIFNFIGNWNAFLWPLIIASKPATYTLPVGLANFSGEAVSEWHLIMTGATLAMVPLIVIFLIFQRQIIKGISLSGMKG
jgi:multiple sugar transport system permease protein